MPIVDEDLSTALIDALIAVQQHSPGASPSFAAVTWPYLMRSLPLRCSKRAGA
ncbi:MAG TPA: hypothetical protein VFF07_12780 [Actinomycetota bacterium]|nr:hypothetical protein [Actinomycetota bacterium]